MELEIGDFGGSFGFELAVRWDALAREGLLFDNCIGRKRDVDGGVLAGIFSRGSALGLWGKKKSCERHNDGHVSKVHR